MGEKDTLDPERTDGASPVRSMHRLGAELPTTLRAVRRISGAYQVDLY
jgi:hypothetical protein